MVLVAVNSAACVVVGVGGVDVDVITHSVVNGAAGKSVSVTSVLGKVDPMKLLSTSEGTMDAGRGDIAAGLDRYEYDVESESTMTVVDGEMETAYDTERFGSTAGSVCKAAATGMLRRADRKASGVSKMSKRW